MPLIRSKRARGWLLNIAIILAFYWAVQLYQGRDAPSSGPAPQIEGIDLNGQPVSLQAHRGQATLIYFWATWCRVCALSRDTIADIARDHPVITIASQSGSDAELSRYVKEHGFNVPVINDHDNRLSQRYGVRAFPSIFIIDGDGNISDVEIGLSSEWGLRLRLWKAGW